MELAEIRVEIDEIDNELKALFIKRMGLAKDIAAIKAETGDAIYKPDREREIIERLSSDVAEDIREGYTAWIKQLLQASRNYQELLLNHD